MALFKLSYTWVIFLLLISPVKGEDRKENDGWCWSDYVVPIVVGTVAVAAAPLALSTVGFTASGVAAGSIAASAQSVLYGGAVASGGVFAGLQGAGAAGVTFAGKVAIGTTFAGAAKIIKDKFSPCNGGPKCPSDD